MRVVLFGHASVGVTELLGDDGHRNATHGKLRGTGVPQDVKRDRRCNARLCLATLRRAVPEDSDVIFERLRAEGFDAAYLVPNPLAFANQSRIGELGSSHRIATVGDYPSFARNCAPTS
jgi:hypothetical protein